MPSLELYGIVFGGTSWTLEEQAKILAAVERVGQEFSRVGLGSSSWEAFKAVYGNEFLFYRDHSDYTHCDGGAEPHTIKCFNDAPMSEADPARLLVHELGHALVQTRYLGSRAPYSQLRYAQIVDDYPDALGGPRWVTGTHPTWSDCQSNPNLQKECAATNKTDLSAPDSYGKFERTGRGYLSTLSPDLYHGSNWPDWATSPNEDFADMFMNWAYNTFDYNVEAYNAGVKRYDFMERNMLAWITG
jgi:hypothetical protein